MAAPNAVNYTDQLPLGIEAKAQRRLFFPSTGDNYDSEGNSIIRISLNYDGMLDTSQSYFKFDFANTSTLADGTTATACYKDLGQPEIARLVVSSGGVVLEDIQNYDVLQSGIVGPCSYNTGNIYDQMNNFNAFAVGVASDADATKKNKGTYLDRKCYGRVNNSSRRGAGAEGNFAIDENLTIGVGAATTAKRSICYQLNSALLNCEKYLPLVLMNNGLDIEVHINTGVRTLTTGLADDLPTFSITNPRYVAHLIDLQRDFYDMLRMTQQQSGGVIQIAGQTWRHFSNSLPAGQGDGQQTYNVPVRARSIKSVMFCNQKATPTANTFQSASTHMNVSDYQVQVGATKYPPTAILVGSGHNANLSEPYNELMKSWGKLGSAIHDNMLAPSNYLNKSLLATAGAAESAMSFSPYGIDLETFRAELENGIDTSSRALPMSLLVNHRAVPDAATAATLHTFVLIDALFFVNMDGSVSVSA